MINRKVGIVTPGNGYAVSAKEAFKADRNLKTFKSDNFHKACDACEIPQTKRQASKWNNKKGLAYKSCH